MRSCKFLLLLGTVVIVAASLSFYGCSDDETSTGTIGSLSDPEFLAVHEQVSQFVDSTMIWFNDGLGAISSLSTDTTVNPIFYGPTDPNVETDDSYVLYTDDGWHVVYFAFHTDEYNSVLMDSIQFQNNDIFQQGVADLDALLYKHNWEYIITDTTITHINYTGNVDYQFDNLDQDQCSITGSSNWTADSKFVSADSTVWRGFDVDITYTGGKISRTGSGWAQGCPDEGTFSASVEMTYKKDAGDPVVSTWNVTVTFDHGVAAVVASKGGITWSYTSRECWPPSTL